MIASEEAQVTAREAEVQRVADAANAAAAEQAAAAAVVEGGLEAFTATDLAPDIPDIAAPSRGSAEGKSKKRKKVPDADIVEENASEGGEQIKPKKKKKSKGQKEAKEVEPVAAEALSGGGMDGESKKGKKKKKKAMQADSESLKSADVSVSAAELEVADAPVKSKKKKSKKSGEKDPAWVSLATQHLAETGGKAKVKALQTAVLASAGISADAALAARSTMLKVVRVRINACVGLS